MKPTFLFDDMPPGTVGPAPEGVIASDGTLVAVNAAWRDAAVAKSCPGVSADLGADLLSTYAQQGSIAGAASALRDIVCGTRETYAHDFEQEHEGDVSYWTLRARRVLFVDQAAVIISMHRHTRERERMALLRALVNASGDAFWILDAEDGAFLDANDRTLAMLGYERSWLRAHHIADIDARFATQSAWVEHVDALMTHGPMIARTTLRHHDEALLAADVATQAATYEGRRYVLVAGRDITEQRKLEMELLQSRKLEAIGQLAAGIAHEINTPMQYVGDNLHFLTMAFGKLRGLVDGLVAAVAVSERQDGGAESPTAALIKKTRLDYLNEHVPRALDQARDGVERVRGIVVAMKDFSHSGQQTKSLVDVNSALRNTAIISRNEWKYVADIVFDLSDDMPPVPALAGELNQVFLNLLVNAAHAISAAVGDTGNKGTITISTTHSEDTATVRIRDTGTGIPAAIRGRVFDPFFTTKPVGKGTGQGLAIARSVVVDKHAGTLTFETEENVGTAFIVRLPRHEHTGATEATDEADPVRR